MWGFIKAEQPAKKRVETKVTETKVEVKKVSDWKTDSMHFIADFEWFRECAYYDSKQWSIWYGTKSFPWECITRDQAIQRKKDHLHALYQLVDRTCYNDNQKISLVSYMYNVWVNAMGIQSYVKDCNHKRIVFIMNTYGWTIKGKWSNWLAKRRNIEINKFNSLPN